MNWWRLVNLVSGMLEPAERDVVRGDIEESGETGVQALGGVLGLVARRQAAMWKDWRPWFALVALVVPLGILLSVVSTRTAHNSAIYIWLYANNWDWTLLANTAFQHDFPRVSANVFLSYLTLACWSWTAGFLLSSVARRTIAVTGALFCLVLLFAEPMGMVGSQRDLVNNSAVFAVKFYRVMFPPMVQAILVALPALWGMRQRKTASIL